MFAYETRKLYGKSGDFKPCHLGSAKRRIRRSLRRRDRRQVKAYLCKAYGVDCLTQIKLQLI